VGTVLDILTICDGSRSPDHLSYAGAIMGGGLNTVGATVWYVVEATDDDFRDGFALGFGIAHSVMAVANLGLSIWAAQLPLKPGQPEKEPIAVYISPALLPAGEGAAAGLQVAAKW